MLNLDVALRHQMFQLRAPKVTPNHWVMCLGIAWTSWDGVGVWLDNVSATLFFGTRFPFPC